MSKNENDRLITVEQEGRWPVEYGRDVTIGLHDNPYQTTTLRLSPTEARDLHQRLGAYLVQEGSL